MKTLTLATFLLIAQNCFAQDIIRKEIADFTTNDKIKKQITFTIVKDIDAEKLLIKANNITESTTRSCAWEVDLSKGEASQFAIKLDNAAENCTAKLDADWLTSNTTIKCIRNKLKIKMENAICTSGHQISYFQKDCNKKLSFIIEQSKGEKIAQYLTNYLNSGNDLVVER